MHLLTQSAVLRALGWCLFDSCWQMALLWGFYAVVINMYKGASAHLRHGLALGLLGAGACWSACTFIQAYNTPDQPGLVESFGNWVAIQANAGAVLLTRIRQFLQTGLSFCSVGYLLVLFFFLIRYSVQYLYTRKLKQTGLTKMGPEYRLFVEQTCRRMSITRPVGVWLSSMIDVPVTLGFFKPVILIPFATAANLSVPQLEAILLHELAHIKRNDYLVNLGVAILEILFFFNPFTRLFIRDIKREREHRCDDIVMQFRYDPREYVTALLSLATRKQAGPQLALAAAGDNDRMLLRRTRRILQLPATRDRISPRPLLFLIGTLLITGLIGLGMGSWNTTNLDRPNLIGVFTPMELQQDTLVQKPGNEKQPVKEIRFVSFERTGNIKPTAMRPVIFKVTARMNIMQPSEKPIILLCKSDEAPEASQNNEDDVDQTEQADDVAEQPLAGQAVATFKTVKRDYSIKIHNLTITKAVSPDSHAEEAEVSADNAKQPAGPADAMPYVPNTSFSYYFVQDSARPDQQLVYLQKQTSQEAALAVKKMQAELQLQLHILQITHSQEEKAVVLEKKSILEQQLKLQQEYLKRQNELLRRYEQLNRAKTVKVRRIVDI